MRSLSNRTYTKVFLWLALAAALSPGQGVASPQIVIEEPTQLKDTIITVSDLEVGGEAMLIGVSQRVISYVTRVEHFRWIDSDSDRDGTLRFTVEGDIPTVSLWVAVDLSTGKATAAAPDDFAVRNLQELQPGFVDSLGFEGTSGLELAGASLEVFWIRPGIRPAVWHGSLADGGPLDVDPSATRLALQWSSLTSLTADAEVVLDAPESADVLVVIDPRSLRWTHRTTSELLAASGPGKGAEELQHRLAEGR